jgi:hypothetical protein
MKSMSSIERYSQSGWYLIALPGVYAVSVFWLSGWMLIRLTSASVPARLSRRLPSTSSSVRTEPRAESNRS